MVDIQKLSVLHGDIIYAKMKNKYPTNYRVILLMPELPEVETTCRGIEQVLKGKTLLGVKIRESRLRWPISSEILQLKKVKIIAVERRAKYILLRVNGLNKGTIIIHLGMSGRLCVLNADIAAKKHDHVDFILDDKRLLRFTDHRRFGAILWAEGDPLQHSLLENLGPEPLSAEFTGKYLFGKLGNKKQPIKLFIMKQQIVVGVGNIYANEALFTAKIHPHRSVGSLSLEECNILVKAIKTTLQKAIEKGGTTLRDFLSPDGKQGYFSQQLWVYGREGKDCLKCKTKLSVSRIGQRATVFCEGCQR